MILSIVIPIYNAEKTLRTTLDSCYNSSFRDFEIIAVNDQSTDETLSILKGFEYLYKDNFHILNTADINDKGIVAALNYGLRAAKGDYIARLDADDYIDRYRFESQLAEFGVNPELLLCSTDARLVNDLGVISNARLYSTDNIEELEYKCCIIHPSVMFKRNYFIDNNLFYDKEFEYAEDYDLWLRLCKIAKGNFYKRVPRPLLYYRVGGENRISAQYSSIQKQKAKDIREKHGIKPYLSIINLGDENLLRRDLSFRDFFNYEIISENEIPKGKYVAYSKYENKPNRFDIQIQFLNSNKDYVACGTQIDTGKNSFFYTSDPDIIEAELLKGKITIEQSTILFRNHYESNPNIHYFSLLNNLLYYGRFTNIQQPLVKIEDYSGVENKNVGLKAKEARETYKQIINVVQLNITSEGNFSGVDRYLKTLEDNYPSFVRCRRITLKASNDKLEFDFSNKNHVVVYYNPSKTKLENLYDIIWDNLSYMFVNKRNLIVQSNCFNLFTLITYLRRKVNLIHICMMHCVPYRELIRHNKEDYIKMEELFLDETKEFPELQWHLDAINLADHVILNTLDAEKYYHRVGYTTPYTIIPNGIESIGLKNRAKGDPFKFIFVGHASPLKGLDRLLPLIEKVSKKRNIELHWAGASDPVVMKIIEEKKLPIISHGVLDTNALNKLYQEVDCTLIATACETCSYAALESLSAGLPIISTKVHGVEEIVENVGLLVNMNMRIELDAAMYEDAMLKIIDDDNLRSTMSNRSLERFKDYDIKNIMPQIIKLYRSLLK